MKKTILSVAMVLAVSALSAQVVDPHYYLMTDVRSSQGRKEIAIPDIMGYRTIKGDFHIHTIYSDGQVLPVTRVEEAWLEGLDAIAITDHNGEVPSRLNGDFNTSYKEAVGRAKAAGVTLIEAIEYTDSKPVGHLNFLFIDDANQYARDIIEPKEAVEKAAGKGAFVIYNHPGWPDCNSDLFDFQIDLINRGMIHAVEIFNGNEFYPMAVGYSTGEYNLAPFGNSDIHGPINSFYDLNKSHRNITLVFAKDNSVEAIKEAMFARRTVAWGGNFLAGKQEYLSAIMKGSLTMSGFRKDNSRFSCAITNSSDVTYVLEGANYETILLPAHQTVRISNNLKNLSFNYKVKNLFVGTCENLEIPLGYILTDDKRQVDMPFIKPNITFFDPATPIKVETFTPDAQIRYTIDGSEPTESSPLYSGALKIEKSALLKMKAFKSGFEPSLTFIRQAVVDTPQPALKVSPKQKGVSYDYYEGKFISVYQFESNGEKKDSGTLPYFDITGAKVKDNFGFDFSGYFYAPETGIYTFTTCSDDGSVFIVDDAEVVDNDGSHGAQYVSGRVALQKGFHSYSLKYLEDFEGETLNLYWQKPSDRIKVEMPADVFYIKK